MKESVLVSREDLAHILEFYMDVEQTHFMECQESGWSEEELEGHIYMSLRRLEDCVNDQG